MKEFKLNKMDIDGIVIPIRNGHILRVDRYGFQLFNKYGQNGSYGWRYNISIGNYYRVIEYVFHDKKGKAIKNYITFQRELLDLPGTIPISFRNGDCFDLRIYNLLVYKGKYPALYCVRKLEGNDYGIKFDIPSWYSVYC